MNKAFVKSLQIIEEFRKIDPEMRLQMVATFMTVANEEGITMKELGARLGISQSSCSRNVAALAQQHWLNKPGHDLLIATEDPDERRRKILKLTAKGRRVAEAISKIWE